jgi:hypothetical protein
MLKVGDRMKEAISVAAGILVTPLASAVVLVALGILTEEHSTQDLIGLVALAYVYSLATVLLSGLPAFLMLRRLALVRLLLAALVGFLMGALVGVSLVWPLRSYLPLQSWIGGAISNLVALGVTGAASAFVFWLIWKKGAPTRTRKAG